jgi:hypothetical protein
MPPVVVTDVPCRFYDLTFNGGFIVIYVKDKTAQRRARSNMVQRRGKLRRRYMCVDY